MVDILRFSGGKKSILQLSQRKRNLLAIRAISRHVPDIPQFNERPEGAKQIDDYVAKIESFLTLKEPQINF